MISLRFIVSCNTTDIELNGLVSLGADFTVWAASPEAEFLGSGRFIWAHWDVDELKEIFAKVAKGEIEDGMSILGGMFEVNKKFKLGIVGWP